MAHNAVAVHLHVHPNGESKGLPFPGRESQRWVLEWGLGWGLGWVNQRMEARKRSGMRSGLESEMDSSMDSQMDSQMGQGMSQGMGSRMDPHMGQRMGPLRIQQSKHSLGDPSWRGLLERTSRVASGETKTLSESSGDPLCQREHRVQCILVGASVGTPKSSIQFLQLISHA